MAARTQEQYDRRRQRRQERKDAATQYVSTYDNWKSCGWCKLRFNPVRPKSWLGRLVCPSCQNFFTLILHNMRKMNLVKLKKKSKVPSRRRPMNWRGRGQFDPDRPWMKWMVCQFCTIPICVNNYNDHRSRVKKWRGNVICGKCQEQIKVMLPQLVELKYLKIKEPQ